MHVYLCQLLFHPKYNDHCAVGQAVQYFFKQEAQLSRTGRAMPRVVGYLG